MLIDAHTHLRLEDRAPLVKNLLSEDLLLIVNGSTSEECAALLSLSREARGRFLLSFGVHPWNASRKALSSMLPYLPMACAVGEIGMDAVWCETPHDVQRDVFIAQLEVAQQNGKPIVLHTKGYELEVADIISAYTVRKLVHWYSCADYLGFYVEQGCWFTVGPAVSDPAVLQVAACVPLDKLLLETDGFEAVHWASGETLDIGGYRSHLYRRMCELATLRGVTVEYLEKRMEENLSAFLRE